MSVVCVCSVWRAYVYEQMLQLYPDERLQKKKYEHQGELTYIASLLLCVQYCFRIKVMHALLLVYLAHTPRSGTQHIS